MQVLRADGSSRPAPGGAGAGRRAPGGRHHRWGRGARRADSGIEVLGHPLGSDAFCRRFFAEKAADTNDLALQSSYLLLRYCCEPRIAHLLRAAPPELIADACGVHDDAILWGANTILGPHDALGLNGELGPMARGNQHGAGRDVGWLESIRLGTAQLRLPLRKAGAGLVAAADVSPSAYLGGCSRLARFLGSDMAERGNFPLTGAEFATALAEAPLPHCEAARVAWQQVGDEIAANNIVGRRIQDLACVDNLAGFAAAHENLQRQLGHELADGRWRQLVASCHDVGDVVGATEVRRLWSQTARGGT